MSAPVMILAGGTGGHIFPGLAVAQALREREVAVVWLGSRGGMECGLVDGAGYDIETIGVRAIRGKGAAALLLAPLRLVAALAGALAVLRRRSPGAVISFGGFAAGPGGLAAWLLRRPLLVHEQNAAPGLTNRVLARLAGRVLTGFPDSFPGLEHEVVGNPVRAEIAAIPTPAERLAGRHGPVRVLVIGGSQGARALNRELPAIFAASGLALQLRHQCGRGALQACQDAYAVAGLDADIVEFIDDVADAYAWADLVVCRAGASTVAELAAAGVASVLVPYPHAVDDHQSRNADYLATRGAARSVTEGDGFARRLAAAIGEPLADPALRLRMAEAARACARTDAAARVADACLELRR